ncbi:MAG TPA: hypothetical protein VF988_06640 [Verrucomicrobiae bacterium]
MSEFISACPKCGKQILCDTQYAGQRVACPICMQEIVMPTPAEQRDRPASAPSPTSPPISRSPAGRKKYLLAAVPVTLVVASLVVGWAMLHQHQETPPPSAPPARPPAVRETLGCFTTDRDIGADVSGSATYSAADNAYRITAAGLDIWNDNDQFHYVFRQVNGDVTLVAKLTDFPTDRRFGGKAGLMFRQSLDAGAAYVDAFLNLTPGSSENRAKLEWREAAGSKAAVVSTILNVEIPIWFKLQRFGGTCRGSFSTNGVNWVSLGNRTLPGNGPIYAGLVVCGNGARRHATFDEVSLFEPQ